MHRALIAATVLATAVTSMAAVPPPDNAALHYLRAISIYDRTEINNLHSEIGDDKSIVAPGTEGAQKLIDSQQAVSIALRGAFMDECDFEIDYSHGFDTLLPHLGQIRALARLLAADAVRLEVAGDFTGSATRVAALYRLSDHISQDSVLIGCLVGMAIAGVAHDRVEHLAAEDLSDQDRKIILDAIDSLPADDPFHMIAAIEMEKEIIVSWLPQKFAGEDAATQFLDGMSGALGHGPNDDQRAQFEALDEQGFVDAVNLAATSYDEVIAALYEPDMAERLAEIEKRVEDGTYGLIAKMVVPSFGRAAESAVRSQGALAAAREQIAPKDD